MLAIIETERLHLRPLASADLPAIFRIRSDPEAMRFWDWPAVTEPETVAETIAAQIADMAAGNSIYWSACLGDEVIGVCDLSEIERHHRRAEVGFLFARAFWGRGFAQEAMRAIGAYAFGPLELERLWARIHANNEDSRRLLMRLGFSYEGTLSGHIIRDGARQDCQIYGLLRG